jgi:N-acetylglucosaminyldiphosphoundecaprenol N-acetyl-beta-D-mannosaminyltransferase
MHYRALGVPVVLGVGAVIDFLAGRVRRAPRWMRHCGLEWTFRLAQEPRRLFGRYADDMRSFGGALLAQCWQLRWRASGAVRGWAVWAHAEPHELHVQVAGRFDRDAIAHTAGLWTHIQADHSDCVFDLGKLQAIDSTGVALLLKLKNELRETGRELTLVAPSAAARRAFAEMQLADFFTIAAPGGRRRAA